MDKQILGLTRKKNSMDLVFSVLKSLGYDEKLVYEIWDLTDEVCSENIYAVMFRYFLTIEEN